MEFRDRRQCSPVWNVILFAILVVQTNANAPPVVTGWPHSSYLSFPEDYDISKPIFNFTITDPDKDKITVTMHPETKTYINLSSSEGPSPLIIICKLKKRLDRETNPTIDFKFDIADTSLNSIPKHVTIYVNDVNDNKPVFVNLPYTWDIAENVDVNQTYDLVSAVDADGGSFGTVRYSMEPVTQSEERRSMYRSTFNISENNGKVILLKSLDYETNNYYQFNVTAKDGGGLTTTTPLIIRVKDVQDTHPFFDRSIYQATITEEIKNGWSVINVHAIDGDRGVPNDITYLIKSGECKEMFKVDEKGSVSTIKRIDRDTKPFSVSATCNLTIMASEVNTSHTQQYGSTTNTTSVYITVIDINDNPPWFNASDKEIQSSIPENSAENSPVYVPVSVKDIDQGENAKIKMKIVWPPGTCEAFKVLPSTVSGSGTVGVTVKNKTCLDYETVKQINFTIIASDINMKNLTSSMEVSVNITDVNDNNPKFGNIKTTYWINENSPNGTSVATLIATDLDDTSKGNLTYNISGGNERFVVNPIITGEIRTHCKQTCSLEFDRERYSSFTISYIVKDEDGRSDLRSITINLLDLNDNIPTFYRTEYKVFIDEKDNNYTTKPLIQLDASDKDETDKNNKMTFSILDTVGIPPDNITINNTSGQLFLTSPVDYENMTTDDGTIRLIASVTDNGNNPMSSNSTVIITVQDVNDNEPNFVESIFYASVAEDRTSNTTSKTNVINVNATDLDGTRRNSDFHYFIIDGAFEKFAINSKTGLVTVQINAELDREARPQYNITLNTIDQGSQSFTCTATLQINIKDVNDEPPVFNKTVYSTSITENSTKGTNVKQVTATDQDLNKHLSYSITNVTARDENGKGVKNSDIQGYFSINSSNGMISVKSSPDREVAKTVKLELLVEDLNAVLNGPQNDTAVMDITILDVNDNNPKFINSSYSVNVPENAPNPTIIGRISATDADENRTITYGLQSSVPTSYSFDIDKTNGQIMKKGPINRETCASYILTVSAIDSGVPPRTSFVNVTVKVTDVNDNPPVFNMTTSFIHVPENITVNSSLIKVNATDIDEGRNQEIFFKISSGAFGKFQINSTTGWVSISSELDWETRPTYNLIITAKDNPIDNSTRKSRSATLNITVDDVNDNSPLFQNPRYETSRPENIKVGTSIITLTATDIDEPKTQNSNITYRFVNDTSQTFFSLNPTSGVVTVIKSLKDKVGNYTVIVKAADQGNPQLSSITTLMIRITDVNLHNPVIGRIPNNYILKVYECIQVDKMFWSFNYKDADHDQNAEAFFNITGIGENIDNDIKIYPNGSLVVKQTLNENMKKTYKFQVTATDKGLPPLTSKPVAITLEVMDVNDNPPEFTNDTIYTSIFENQKDTLVAKVKAIDIDSNSTSCYSIMEMNGIENSTWDMYFNISKMNGEIYNIQELDYELVKAVSLVVNVKDCSVNSSDQCDTTIATNTSTMPNVTVEITVKDVDDNPPTFLKPVISTGMRRTVEPGSVLKLQLRNSEIVEDDDSAPNGFQAWQFANNGEIMASRNLKDINTTSGINACGNKTNYILCLETNGTITNNKYFSEDLYGYFEVPVIVYDRGGNDTAIVKIDLIGDTQILTMTVLDTKEVVSTKIDELLKAYSDLLGQEFVYDGLEDHKEGDMVYSGRSDLFFHVRAKDGTNVMPAKEAEILLDKKANTLTIIQRRFHIATIQTLNEKSRSTSNPELKFYVLLAIVAFLTLILILVIVASMITRNTYRRKVKAVTVQDTALDMIDGSMNIPGSNQFSKQANPLLNAKVEKMEAKYDTISHKSNDSLDSNVFDDQNDEMVYDKMEEREVTMDMYTDDRYGNRPVEDPLDAALRLHEMSKSFESLDIDNHSFQEDEEEDEEKETQFRFENYAFDDMEATEI